MVLKGFERRLERMVEGAFARVFRSGLRPVELGRRLVREMDDGRTIDVRGRQVAPNDFVVLLGPDDAEHFAEVSETLCRELAGAARDHARDEGYQFLGPVHVAIETDHRYRSGAFAIEAHLREAPGGAGVGSLVLGDGRRLPLQGRVCVVGRQSTSDVVVNDPNVSRRHAEVRPVDDGYELVDLGSTNGSRVNGERVVRRRLVDGDELTFGHTTVFFEEA